MGQLSSTPLELFLSYLKDVKTRGQNLSVIIRKDKLTTFLQVRMASHQHWLPPPGGGGTFDLGMVQGIKKVIFKPKLGHSDQIPYVVVWQDLLEDWS